MASDFMNSLVEKGYFPQEITPWFTTSNLVPVLDAILTNIGIFPQKTSKPCKYSIPKGKQRRRLLSIPNPLHQIKLCKVIDDDWGNIRGIIARSRMSLTIPSVRARSLRALSRKFSFEEISEKIIHSSTSAKYMLRTDISRYYATIYTHSIPWAMHTKEVAKARRRDSTLIGNKIDSAVQSCQDGQTNGILVGPDTSLLISEILCASMDEEVRTRVRYKAAFRYIDDYFLFFDNIADAEKAFYELHKIIREYELELNPYKTKIVKLPEPIEPEWVSALNISPTNKSKMISYVSHLYEYAKKYPEEEVLKYGLTKIRNVRLGTKMLEIVKSFVLHVMLHEPSAIPLAVEMLVELLIRPNDGEIEVINQAMLFNAEYGYEFELSWLLWLCSTLSISVKKEVAEKISLIDNSIVALTALKLKDQGLINDGLDLSRWSSLMKTEELYDDNWLLAYEAYIKGWLPSVSGVDYISADPFFSMLKTNNVEFFDPGATIVWKHKSASEKWLYNEFSPAF